jgi:EmrB/QacA subfamily drug resistance transporter
VTSVDAAPPAAVGIALHSSTGRTALVATVAASAMASLDATVVNVALPHIGRDLGESVSSLQWVLTGYLLTLSSLILLGGALGDRLGRRKVFVVGTIWFAAASVVCGLAPSVEVLVGGRLLQGVGGALLTPGSLAILQASFRESDRAAAVGAWSGLGGAAGALGPIVGGALVDGPGWRWAFLINVPVAALAVACARAAVPETRSSSGTGRLDVTGAGLAAGGLAASTWSLTAAGPRGWGDPAVLGAAAAAVVATLAFVRRMRHTTDPLVPPSLFRDRTFVVVNLATVLLYAGLGVSFFAVAYQLQVANEWSAIESGAALLPATVMMLVFSSPSASLAQRIGPRLQLTVGPLLAGLGLLLLSRVGAEARWLDDVLPGALVFGLGLVTFVAPLTATVMAAAGPDHVSVASGVNNAVARASSLTALAVVPVVSGLAVANDAADVTAGFRSTLVIAAVLAVIAAPLALVGLRPVRRAVQPLRRVHCPVDGPPVELSAELPPVPSRSGGRG